MQKGKISVSSGAFVTLIAHCCLLGARLGHSSSSKPTGCKIDETAIYRYSQSCVRTCDDAGWCTYPARRTRPRATVRLQQAGPSRRRLDIEAEIGFIVGTGSTMGEPVDLADFDRHVFGPCVLNDWSARDIQGWEYTPLGPFQTGTPTTSISPWIIPLAALSKARVHAPNAPCRCCPISTTRTWRCGGLDLQLEASLNGTPISRPPACTGPRHRCSPTRPSTARRHTRATCTDRARSAEPPPTSADPSSRCCGTARSRSRSTTARSAVPRGRRLRHNHPDGPRPRLRDPVARLGRGNDPAGRMRLARGTVGRSSPDALVLSAWDTRKLPVLPAQVRSVGP